MGKLNDELCHFLNRPEVFAELFNVALYGGKREVKPENLGDVQRNYGETLTDRYGKTRKKIRERDVVKALRMNGGFALLAVENQASRNYCMPLRCLEYDVEDFARQLRRLRRHYKQTGGLKTGAEYLSGIKESDRLIPNITIVLYHGKGKWNAAEQLQDMVNMEVLDEKMKALHMNYKLYVVNLTELDENLFETGLQELIGIMKRVDDKDQMQEYLKENAARLQNMDDDLYDLICEMAGIKDLTAKRAKENRKEENNMCKAWDDMKADSREAGRREGKREGRKEGREAGRREGRKEGEEKLGALIRRLCQDGREAEVVKAAGSVQFRNRLYREYGMLS